MLTFWLTKKQLKKSEPDREVSLNSDYVNDTSTFYMWNNQQPNYTIKQKLIKQSTSASIN